MFNRIKERRQRELMEKVSTMKPTSKYELKQSCLMLAHLDIDKAEKMYDFMVKDIGDIPDIPLAQKPLLENIKEQSTEIFGWLRENEDVLTKGAQFIRGLFSKKVPAEPLPPINK